MHLHNDIYLKVKKMSSYCIAINTMKSSDVDVHRNYHDHHYGFPINNDDELFCRLVMEINQAGLSWTTILKKETGFRKAYHNFEIRKVNNYREKDIQRLLNDPAIIRNRLKINAAIANAKRIMELQKEYGSFGNWLNENHPLSLEDWVKLFKKNFKFTGGEIVKEFLVSSGYLPGAHDKTCSIYKKIMKEKPMWMHV